MDKWSKEFPAKRGLYWFYGDPHSANPEPRHIQMHITKVVKISNGFAYICDGAFIYKQTSFGSFLPALVPEPPEEIE